MAAPADDTENFILHLDQLAATHGYSKIFAKVPASQQEPFTANGYQIEAGVPGLFNDGEKGLFLGKYPAKERSIEKEGTLIKDVLDKTRNKRGQSAATSLGHCLCRPLIATDMTEAARLFQRTFASYPFPITDPGYLLSTMDHIAYYGIWVADRLVALSSAEIDNTNANAEMTDFATDTEFQGKGLANLLLTRMEKDMAASGIKTLYTIARACSYGMNICFAKNDYIYSGTLTNNTQISGQLESMNVWYKQLPATTSPF